MPATQILKYSQLMSDYIAGIINRILSWKGWIVLSRLTFSVYLLHYFIVQAFVVQLRHPFFYKPDFEAVSNIFNVATCLNVLIFWVW